MGVNEERRNERTKERRNGAKASESPFNTLHKGEHTPAALSASLGLCRFRLVRTSFRQPYFWQALMRARVREDAIRLLD